MECLTLGHERQYQVCPVAINYHSPQQLTEDRGYSTFISQIMTEGLGLQMLDE